MVGMWRYRVVVFVLGGVLAGGCAWVDRVSVDTNGGDANGPSGPSGVPLSISGDGRYVAFSSLASDLVAGDGNSQEDVFRRDLRARTTTRVSVDTGGGDPNRNSNNPSISANGRLVAFSSFASDLVPGDGNNATDVFVRDLQTGTTTRVSIDAFGGDPSSASTRPSISADGRYVAFESVASDLVPGDGNNASDVFVRDLQTGGTIRVGGSQPNAGSAWASISADGRYVAFESSVSDLVPGDGNATHDVFRLDLQTQATTRVSVDTSGGDANTGSERPSISGDGRYVAFSSFATDLVPGDGNATRDVFRRDVQAGTTARVNDSGGGDPNQYSDSPRISNDGRYVAFHSLAGDLIAGDSNAIEDVFVRDWVLGRTIRLSQDLLHGQADGPSINPKISGDGRYAAFQSGATNLVGGDANGVPDMFVKYTRIVTVSAIAPASLPRGATNVAVTISGTGFEPGSTLSLAKPSNEGGSITVTNLNVASDSKITAVFSVASDAPTGAWTVRVIHPPTALGADRVAAGQCTECLQIT